MTPQSLNVERSLETAAQQEVIWRVITEPRYLRQWMEVVPHFTDESPLQPGSRIEWRDADGQAYLVGRITTFAPHSQWQMELQDASWQRAAGAGEVTYGFRLSQTPEGVRIDFHMGDLAIDPEGETWRDTYARSRELERIVELAQALASQTTVESEVLAVIRGWERAIQSGDMAGILAQHAEDVVMFDVPEPLQSLGLDAYRKTWELFFRYGAPSPDLFVIEDLRITAGEGVAFASGLLRIGGSAKPICRLTLGLEQRAGRWLIVHEHHSAPHALQLDQAP